MKQLRYWLYLIVPVALLGWATSWGVGVAAGIGIVVGMCLGGYVWYVQESAALELSGMMRSTEDGKNKYVPKSEILRGMFTEEVDTVNGRGGG